MYNTIITLGNLVSDPTVNTTKTGKTVCKMRMCISDSYEKEKCFIDVEAWDKTAEACMNYLSKGREVLVEGSLCSTSWKDKEDKTVSRNFIRASKVRFTGAKKAQENGEASQSKSGPAKTQSTQSQGFAEDGHDDIPF
jgi:single-strand DNA-binding protein